METIKNYLEMMFQNLPNTPEVRRAHDELLSMMEDKYENEIASGRPENEAVAAVISEFGNLDEIAETLGISSVIHKNNMNDIPRRHVSFDEVKRYFSDKTLSSIMCGIAILLYICCPTILMAVSVVREDRAVVGLVSMFIFISVATGLLIYESTVMSKWKYLKKTACDVDYSTVKYAREKADAFNVPKALLTALGVILCIMCPVPLIVIGIMDMSDFMNVFGVVILLIMVGLGVLMMVASSGIKEGYDRILKLNDARTVGGNYVPEQEEVHYNNKTVEVIMSVYWSMITCIYLSVSFLTFAWGLTWLIWPFAALIKKIIDTAFSTEA